MRVVGPPWLREMMWWICLAPGGWLQPPGHAVPVAADHGAAQVRRDGVSRGAGVQRRLAEAAGPVSWLVLSQAALDMPVRSQGWQLSGAGRGMG